MSFNNIEEVEGMRLRDSRLNLIQYAIDLLKKKNMGFLKKYQQTQVWNKLKMGLIANGQEVSLKNSVDLKVCPHNSEDESYFNPFVKRPIVMCFNKIDNQQKFDRILSYNMILLYDTKTKGYENQNWNKLQDTTYSTIRALNLSKTCDKNDYRCFQKYINQKILTKERFKGMVFKQGQLRKVYQDAISDTSPISQIINYRKRSQKQI